MKFHFLFLAAISNGIINYAHAENNQTILSETINNWAVRKDRLSKIYDSLLAAKTNAFGLDRELKILIDDYRNHLQKIKATESIDEDNNFLLKDIGLLLAKLEAGQATQIKDQVQARNCYELITAIESLFEKLENPQEEWFDSSALPQQSNGIIESYKKLKGETLPCNAKANIKKKKQYGGDELPPPSLTQVKISTLLPETLEEDK